MAIPAGVETVTVTDGGVPITGPDGTLLEGHFTVTGPDLATVKEDDYLFGGLARRWVRAGLFEDLPLVATDATGIDPTGFSYTITFTPRYGTAWTRYFTLPKASPSVILAHILIPDPVTGSYAVLVDPSAPGSLTPTAHAASHATGGSDPITPAAIGAEPTGTATAAVTAHSADTTDVHGIPNTELLETTAGATSKVTAHVGAADPHNDRAWADSKFALATALTALDGTVNDLSTSVTAIDGFLNDCLTRVAAIEQGTAWLGGLNVDGNAQIASGNLTVTGNLAVTGNALGQDTPSTHGIAAWCYDPALAVNSTALTTGRLYLIRVDIAADVNVTRLYWWIGNSGSSPTSGQNHVGLYDSDGVLLASAGADSAISSTGLKTTVIPSQPLATGSWYWVGMLFNSAVPPTLTRASGWTGVESAANLGLAPEAYRFAVNGTGRTALPSSIVPASNTGTDFAGPWVAVGA